MAFPQIWITDETPPRTITVKGRSAVDPDCLVGRVEGVTKPLWIVDGMGKTVGCYVCGLGGNVTASLSSSMGGTE